jgi:hypothetical protein
MGVRPKQIGLSLEDFADFPAEQQETFEKVVTILNPWLGDVTGALSGRLTIGDNVSASYKTFRCTIPQNAFIPITDLQNGWVAYGSPYNLPGYRITMDGLVYVRGVIKDGTTGSGTLLFTLPDGYRPDATKIFALAKSGGAGLWEAEIAANGQVIVGPRNADATWSSLDNITFTAMGVCAPIPTFSGANWPLVYEPQIPTKPSAVFVSSAVDVNGNTSTSFGMGGVDWELTLDNKVRVKQIHGLSPGRTYDITLLTLGR